MRTRYFITAAISAAILSTPADRAEADAKDFFAGAVAGAIVNNAVRNNNQRKRVYRSTKSAKKTYRPRIPATQEGRQIQSSLNYFGFPAGAVDGQLGRKSREAISSYQAYLGYPVTGTLNTFERDLLVNSYNRAQAGGYATQQQVAGNPEGTRGLLKMYRTEMAGGAQAGTTMVMAPQTMQPAPAPMPQMVVAPQVVQPGVMAAAAPAPAPAQVAPMAMAAAALAPVVAAPLPVAPAPAPVATQPQVAKATTGPLPSLFGSAKAAEAAPLSQTCGALGIEAGTTFEFTAADQITDPAAALSQQFCVARGYALSTGQELGQSLGATPEQITQLCGVYGERLKPYVTALGTMDRAAVLDQVTAFADSAGVAKEELSGTAQVCLSQGYANDDTDMAIGSALLLANLGDAAYGELLGHHLHAGSGVPANTSRAQDWFEAGISAAEAGNPVFAPAQPERIAVLRRAVFPTNAAPTEASGVALPTFSISQ